MTTHETTIDDGGTAFPSHGTFGEVNQEGMKLRDYFAAQAMQGLLTGFYSDKPSVHLSEAVRESFHIADAMIAARRSVRYPAVEDTVACLNELIRIAKVGAGTGDGRLDDVLEEARRLVKIGGAA